MTRILPTLLYTAIFLLPVTASANNIYNGGFETGDFTGWILSGNPIPGTVDLNPHAGNYAADLYAAGSLGYLEQLVPTVPGAIYNLSYFLQSDGGTPNRFLTQIDGATLTDQTNIPLQNYTLYSFSFKAAQPSTDLKFGFRNDPGSLYLDDVSVTPVPEPNLAWAGGLAALVAVVRKQLGRSRSSKQ